MRIRIDLSWAHLSVQIHGYATAKVLFANCEKSKMGIGRLIALCMRLAGLHCMVVCGSVQHI